MAPVEHSTNPDPRYEQFEQSVQSLEENLQRLKSRYAEVQTHQVQQASLAHHRQELERQWQSEQLPVIEQELLSLTEEEQALSLALESELLTNSQLQTLLWQGLRQGIMGEAFWQFLRFGGLGVVVGWLLKTWAG